jgi:hypothetical protein
VHVPYADVLEAEVSFDEILQNVKPRLESFDSAQEFSLEHLRAVRKLVKSEDLELDGYVFDDSCLRVS